MFSAAQSIDELIDDLEIIKEEAIKADQGNAAAGTRTRVGLQDAKNTIQDIRVAILDSQKRRKKKRRGRGNL